MCEKDIKLTDKEIKDELLLLENYDIKSTEYDNGVYNSVLTLSVLDEEDNKKILSKAYCFLVNGEEADIVDAADSESGDLYLVADTMMNSSDLKIELHSKIAILDYYYLYSSTATLESKKFLLLNYILPYFKDRGIEYVAFCNAGFEFTNDSEIQSNVDDILENLPLIYSKKTYGDNWKNTVNVMNVKYATDPTLEIDPFLEEYEKETGEKLPDNFEEEYDKYIFDDKPDIVDDILSSIIKFTKFQKNLYYSEDGKRINITSEDRQEMKGFQVIKRNFENIEELYNRVIYAYKNLIQVSLNEDDDTNPNTIVGAFLAEGNAFIDYLDLQWLKHYVSNFKDDWEKICQYIYDNNLGYRLCYNLRNFDQHPQDHSARQIIKEVMDDVGENRVEYYLNIPGIFSDSTIRRKMKEDMPFLQQNNRFLQYARDYMINLTSLYNLALGQFFAENLETIQDVYYYLTMHDFNQIMIKSVDDHELRIMGTDYADDVISTLDIDRFLHQFEEKGIINKQIMSDIRNGNEDTKSLLLTPDQIVRNVIVTNFLRH